MMTRRAAAVLAAGLLAAPRLALADAPAAQPIAALNQALAALEHTASQPFATRYAAFGPEVDRAFDLAQILKTIVGLRWAQIPPAQQTALLTVFRAFTICNYVANFNSDSGDRFRILPETRSVGNDQVVETEIVPKTGDPTRIDYVMRRGAAGWQAIDVLEQGTISQAAVQRSDFRSLLESGGGAALIDSLRKKVATLSGGSIAP
jgi:phospholipid transport system substrate-binding protein